MKAFIVIPLLFCAVQEILGHGYMIQPPNRSSMWRVLESAPRNYDDNQNFCGGFAVQWETFNGSCGVCGDIYNLPHPQDNENTGLYGQGVVLESSKYKSGQVIEVHIELTSNHLGTFSYSLCALEDPSLPESGEECFKHLELADGSSVYHVQPDDEAVVNHVKLPEGFTCERCVLRWHYRAGNNWGWCSPGVGQLGCGPQETFRSCSDIAIF